MPGTKLSAFTCLCVCFSLALSSCSDRGAMARLSDIESYIDSRPDSALAAIRQIDTTVLKRRATKAKYFLLHAMALDKNYIDTADTRVVQPAVDWYSRHGSPEEKLKAWMYLGTEQFNGSLFNNAIVSYSLAEESAPLIGDQNLLGILYSRMAETYTRTQEYSIAEQFIEKSIACFRKCGRKDQENKERIILAKNLVRLKEWVSADSLFKELIRDTSFTTLQKGNIESSYAIAILSSPLLDDTLAYPHFTKALSLNGRLNDFDQYCAYAYVLSIVGQRYGSETILKQCLSSPAFNQYSYDYWLHRIQCGEGDYKEAYFSLYRAKHVLDSISMINLSRSAANAQRVYLENRTIENKLRIQKQRYVIYSLIVFALFFILIVSIIIIQERRRHIEEQGRMSIVIDSLKQQLAEANEEKTINNKKRTKARFTYLSDLFEKLYRLSADGKEPSKEKLYQIISERINIAEKDGDARKRFERDLDEETNGAFGRFKQDFYNLPDQEIRLASYVFAGFDNTLIMLLMRVNTLEYTRVKKNRLKTKIADSSVSKKESYLLYFDNSK